MDDFFFLHARSRRLFSSRFNAKGSRINETEKLGTKEVLQGSRSGLPDFCGYNIPKWGKIPNSQKICIPNGHKIYQMAVKYTKWT
jgi:hypothetical protein